MSILEWKEIGDTMFALDVIKERRAAIKVELARLDVEEAELDIAERVCSRLEGDQKPSVFGVLGVDL